LTVLLRHRCNTRLRRPFPLVTLEPPTIEVDDPHNYEGFVPIEPMAAWEREASKVRILASHEQEERPWLVYLPPVGGIDFATLCERYRGRSGAESGSEGLV
jgi:hypothetical protein